jgi:hypothetical protein
MNLILLKVNQRKRTHAFTRKNDEFNSDEGRQETIGMHTSTLENDGHNSIEGREERKGTHVRKRSYKNRATSFLYSSVN